jgi:hypothetical protein
MSGLLNFSQTSPPDIAGLLANFGANPVPQPDPAAQSQSSPSSPQINNSDFMDWLNSQTQPTAPQQGFLARLVGTDAHGVTLQDRMLSAAAALRGDTSGALGIREAAENRARANMGLKMQLQAQAAKAAALHAGFVTDANGKVRFDVQKAMAALPQNVPGLDITSIMSAAEPFMPKTSASGGRASRTNPITGEVEWLDSAPETAAETEKRQHEERRDQAQEDYWTAMAKAANTKAGAAVTTAEANRTKAAKYQPGGALVINTPQGYHLRRR